MSHVNIKWRDFGIGVVIGAILLFATLAGIVITSPPSPREITGTQTITSTLTQSVTTTLREKESVTATVTTTAPGVTATTTGTTTIPGPTVTVPGPTITVTATTTITAPPVTRRSDLIIRGVTVGTNVFEWYVVRGEVFNNGTDVARFVIVYATFYDVNRNVVWTDFTLTTPSDIYAGEAAPFEVSCTDKDVIPRITSYKLVAEIG